MNSLKLATETFCRFASIRQTRFRLGLSAASGLLAASCAALLLAVTVQANEPSDSAAPVCCWSFHNSLNDSAAGSEGRCAGEAEDHLTAVGGKARFVAADNVPGTVDGAVALGVEPGDAKYLTAKVSSDVQLGPSYTIEAWIHPTQLGGWNRLVLQWGGGPTYAYHFALHNGAVSLCHGQSDGKYIFCEGGTVVADQLQHIVGVAQRNEKKPAESKLTVYLNGRQTGTATFDGTIGKLNDALGIGDTGSGGGDDSRFRGYVDEISIFNRALSAEEIKARCNAPNRVEALRQSELVRERIRQQRLRAQLAQRAAAIDRLQALGVEEIVFAQRGHGRDISGHYYANFGYSCGDPNVWFHADDGTKLTKLNVRTGKMIDLVDDPGGSIRDPQVHYDARKILFSYRTGGTHRYHLYEINTDGTDLRQLTEGPFDDIEATYLPDGDIVFCSSRCHRWIGCWLAETAILYRCDGDGGNIRMLSSGSFTENTPAVLPDGRILYTRWEYVNRDPVSFHHLWTMNPDGTGQMVYYGNMRPGGVFIDARPIPDTNQIVLANIPGHGSNEHFGFMAIASGRHGPNDQASMKNISKNRNYRDPYPLSTDAMLVVSGNSDIALMNGRGETELLYTGEGRPLHEPRAIVRRPREQIVSPRADLTKDSATVFLSDVYFGRNMAGVKPGAIKQLLVMEDLPKPANFHGGGSQPIGHGVTSTIKRILGTVPVEPDGSACFEIPPMRSIYFGLLDEDGKSIKQMRSFVTLQPGEKLSCVGCHEPREQTPANRGRHGRSRTGQMAMGRDPSKIEPIAGTPEIMDFPRDVQPILDRHCVRCHSPDKPEGSIVLVGDRGPVFSLSYYELYLHWQIKDTTGDPHHGTGRQPGNNEPYSTYSSASPLVEMLEPSHHDVKLTPHEKQLVRLWIDVGATYPGTYAAYGSGQLGGCWRNNEPTREMADGWPSTGPAVEAVTRRCGACHPAKQMPYHVTARTGINGWGDMLSWTRPLSRYSRHRVFNLTRPEKSLFLMAALSKQAGGYADGQPAAGVKAPKPVAEDRSR
ncbi:MAG: hypothetical protein HQ567_29540, partial [Candidatus Nealsonbacteria bacterium]|nr:hypothetical protein [Candidatus Nealsonbacteria bacterium]